MPHRVIRADNQHDALWSITRRLQYAPLLRYEMDANEEEEEEDMKWIKLVSKTRK
jgi:hypothetical protein